MQVIIPVAGKGTRLYPHTHTVPKPLLPVAGKPVIEHILERLESVNPSELILVVNPGTGEMIRQHIEGLFPWKIRTVPQEKPLGLGHAVLLAQPGPGPTLVILGDTIIDAELDRWIEQGDFIGVKQVSDPRRFGVVELDQDNRVISAVEKPQQPPTNLAIVGLYYFSRGERLRAALEQLFSSGKRTKNEFQLTDALGIMLQEGWRPGARVIDNWFDCGKLDALIDSNLELLKRRGEQKPELPDTDITPPVFVANDARVHSSKLGPGVSVMSGAVIENCALENCIVSQNAVLRDCDLRRSLIGRNATIIGLKGSISVGDNSVIEAR